MLAGIKGTLRRIPLARRAYREVRSWPERGVFEYHPVRGSRRSSGACWMAGFTLREDGHIVSAHRA
jgi:hypothetical protein